MKLGFIGTGNMAGAIMGGIIKNGAINPIVNAIIVGSTKTGKYRFIAFCMSLSPSS